MINTVDISSKAQKSLRKLPKHILRKLLFWADEVSEFGLRATRKSSGWHDEPLKDKRKGQRSIRLSKAWRAIYIIKDNHEIEFVEITEVNKHEY